jgi:hypothetical protein
MPAEEGSLVEKVLLEVWHIIQGVEVHILIIG